MDRFELAARLIDARQAAGLTQEEASGRAGVSPSTLSGLESAKVARPHFRTLRKVGEALGIDVLELFREPTLSGKVKAPPEQDSPERRDSENVWRAEYLARVDEMLDRWEDELADKVALAESDPGRFFEWLQQVREFGRPQIMGLVSGYTATVDGELEAVINAAEFLGPWNNLWRRIEARLKETAQLTKEDEKRFREWYEEARAVR